MTNPLSDSLASVIFACVAVIACLILIWALVKYLIRVGGGVHSKGPRMKIVTALQLGSRERVVVVEYQGKEYMLGVTASSVHLLDTQTASSVVESDVKS